MRIQFSVAILAVVLSACGPSIKYRVESPRGVILTVLGTMQDGGLPHAGCQKKCCIHSWSEPPEWLKVVCLGLTDHSDSSNYIIEATPDFPVQWNELRKQNDYPLAGILLTHAHIGHYAGLMHLGREVMGAKQIPVHAMPRMDSFLRNNGPWSQLVTLENIQIKPMQEGRRLKLSKDIGVSPFRVPHRDEYSETVGFEIFGPNHSALFIPDIDKWNLWNMNLKEMISRHDYVFIDATFYDTNELPGRNMEEIPHPLVIETISVLNDLNPVMKSKVYFIHTNHTNPLVNEQSEQSVHIEKQGFKVARYGMQFQL